MPHRLLLGKYIGLRACWYVCWQGLNLWQAINGIICVFPFCSPHFKRVYCNYITNYSLNQPAPVLIIRRSANYFMWFCTKKHKKICYIFTVFFTIFFIKSLAIQYFICYNIERIEGQFKKYIWIKWRRLKWKFQKF